MDIKTIKAGNTDIAVVNTDKILITDAQSALELMMSVHFETGCRAIIINKEAIIHDFFVLSTGLAGDVLQKFINYNFRLAIVGDFSGYTSKPLKDFMYEGNNGKDIFFVSNGEEAAKKLGSV